MEKTFNYLVNKVEDYLKVNNLKTMVLGVSGGIDSTVVACICNEVSSRNPEIKFLGRSYPIKNSEVEYNSSVKVGQAFCDDFKVVNLTNMYNSVITEIAHKEYEIDSEGVENIESYLLDNQFQSKISNGNIMARLRMINLYNLASRTGGIVMDTDNLTEHNLGFFTVHGDEGDLNPLADLWKTEVYKLAKWLVHYYELQNESSKSNSIMLSCNLIPTDGNGVSSSDLEQIGGSSYEEVDEILKRIINNEELVNYDSEVVRKIKERHLKSQFKRLERPLPIHILPEKVNNLLLIVDPNNDFVDPLGSLYIKGAETAVDNICEIISNKEFEDIVLVQDTHPALHISNPEFWNVYYDVEVKAFSSLTPLDIEKIINKSLLPNSIRSKEILEYAAGLRSLGKNLEIWPAHCIENTWGNRIPSRLSNLLYSEDIKSRIRIIQKGK